MKNCSNIDRVRNTAKGSSFEEYSSNTTSHVISFRHKIDRARINFYNSTGTVGACYDHPKWGSAQFLCRNANIEILEHIFNDSRYIAAKGYHRKSVIQFWKHITSDGKAIFSVDSACRWRYVASVTGLSTNESELERIGLFFNGLDSLSWERDHPPDIHARRFANGSKHGIANAVIETISKLVRCTVVGIQHEEINDYHSGELCVADVEKINGDFQCANVKDFLDCHRTEIIKLKYQLQLFSRDLQIELLRWIFSRDFSGFGLYDNKLTEIETKFTDDIDIAHEDYSELVYTDEQYARISPVYGVFYTA